MKKLWYRFLCLGGLFLFWGLGIHYAEQIKTNNAAFSVYYPDQSIVQGDFMAAAVYGDIRVKLINYLENETVTGNINEEDAIVTVAEVYSNTFETIPCKLPAEEGLYAGDVNGCMIDKESAYHLFGTAVAAGNQLRWKDKVYIIRGVTDSYNHLLVVYEPDKAHTFRNAELTFPMKYGSGDIENKLFRNKAEELLKTSVTGGKGIILDGQLAGSFLDWIILFPAYLFILWFIASRGRSWYIHWKAYYSGCRKVDRLYRSKYMLKAIILFGILAAGFSSVIFLLYRASGLSLRIPARFIPNGWSNLKSYGYAIKEMTDNLAQLGNMRLYLGDLMLREAAYRCLLFMGAALLMLLGFIIISHRIEALKSAETNKPTYSIDKSVKSDTRMGAFLQPIAAALIILAVYNLLYKAGYGYHMPRYYWLLLPVTLILEELEGLFLSIRKPSTAY